MSFRIFVNSTENHTQTLEKFLWQADRRILGTLRRTIYERCNTNSGSHYGGRLGSHREAVSPGVQRTTPARCDSPGARIPRTDFGTHGSGTRGVYSAGR